MLTLKNNWFLLGIFTSLGLAFLIPDMGLVLNPNQITSQAAIVLIFFLSGFSLPTDEVIQGVKDFKLHLFLQLFIFVLVPLYFFLTLPLLKGFVTPYLTIGIYALACLPTTISSCVIFTSLAQGNTVGTLFNATLSNLLGVVVSPLLLALLIGQTAQGIQAEEFSHLIAKMGMIVLLPFLVGQLTHHFFKNLAQLCQGKLHLITGILLLLIMFFVFCGTIQNNLFRSQLPNLLIPITYLALSNLILVLLAYLLGKVSRFGEKDILSILFTAPQKSLSMGIPLLTAYFSNNPELLGFIILPLVFYHPWQLFVAGLLKEASLKHS